jgi:hypothetical protein
MSSKATRKGGLVIKEKEVSMLEEILVAYEVGCEIKGPVRLGKTESFATLLLDRIRMRRGRAFQ